MNILLIILPLLLVIFLMLKKFEHNNYDNYASVSDAILSHDELIKHAKEISLNQNTSSQRKSCRFLYRRLDDNFEYISYVYRYLNEAAKKHLPLCPASEWLLDNYYIIEEYVKDIQRNTNIDFLNELSIISNGRFKGYPRIYIIALELVSHTDGRLNESQMIEFLNAYQLHNVLSMSEILSLSAMLKIAVIENIRLVCEKINTTQEQWDYAESIKNYEIDKILLFTKDYLSDFKNSDASFIEHLLNILKKSGLNHDLIIEYINNKLTDEDKNLEYLVNHEHQQQASIQITIGNCISSLRLINALDWESIFESLSMVEAILKKDPSEVYSTMDSQTRKYYRNSIKNMSKLYDISETAIARKAINCAAGEESNDKASPENHVGYYLVGKGKKTLLTKLDIENNFFKNAKHALSSYLVPIILITLILSILLGYYAYTKSTNIYLAVLSIIVVFIPSSEISVLLVNWTATHIVKPDYLPKLDLSLGITEDKTTIIIIPTLLPNSGRVNQIISQLELTYLANKSGNLYFALVGDFKDSDEKETSEDKKIVETALKGIQDLNDKYSDKNKKIFFYFNRHRVYSKSQNRWMGWERKRGAILEFNRFLKGNKKTTFTITSDSPSLLKKVKYVITLDADTLLPIDTAKRLIGTISHPLNAAVYDNNKGIVTSGYGLIQPRIGIHNSCAAKSKFTRIFAGQGGIDPYTTAISDVYQDLFGEGIFTGKGIYDVDIYLKALNSSIPENTVLSHDLLEGSYIRVGLATDIELIDGYPEKYSSYMLRHHRWIRGDWQLLSWLSSKVKNDKGNYVKNPLSSLSKWKIIDNLRRSLVSISLILLFSLGLILLPGNPLVWLLYGLVSLFFPLLTAAIDYILLKYYKAPREKLHGNLIYGLKAVFYQLILLFIFLPYSSYMMFDAISRSIYRLYFSKKNLLEWVTAADVEKNLKNDFKSFFIRMLPAIYESVALLILVGIFKMQNIAYAVFFAVIWSISPLVAFDISKPDIIETQKLNKEDIEILRRISRKTWSFYNEFANEEDNYLAIDNYQANPIAKTAHRTSPTNIGFMLIGILSAKDLGYISLKDMHKRLENSISTIEKLDKWNGHLYNWYDTSTLHVLHPRYVSTVDSGNLIGYLIVLSEGLKQCIDKPILDKSYANGLRDTIVLFDSININAVNILDTLIRKDSYNLLEWYNTLSSITQYLSSDNKWSIEADMYVNSLIEELEYFFPRCLFNQDKYNFIFSNDTFSKLAQFINELNTYISINDLKKLYINIINEVENILPRKNIGELDAELLKILKQNIKDIQNNINSFIDYNKSLISRINKIIDNTCFTPLFDKKRDLFSIGYNVEDDKLTNSYYDLLASESRLASYIAVVKREIPVSHWLKLGRTITIIHGYKCLVSWTGTMFEYLMPSLIMKNYRNTLLDETYNATVVAQILYGNNRNLPWGTSESGFYTFDLNLNYQYKAFGVPDLGLKRGLINDMVVSPYSTILALPYTPYESMKNLKKLLSYGAEGEYGLFEAIDYTPERLNKDDTYATVESFMAHHQGMILISLNNLLNKNIMIERFHSNPMIKCGEYLLQEKIPLRILITKEVKEKVEPFEKPDFNEISIYRIIKEYHTAFPICQMLSNGSYTVMLENSGSGYSKKDNLQVTRWRENYLEKNSGFFCFIREVSSNKIWSFGYSPINKKPDKYTCKFSLDKAEFFRTDDQIDTHTSICVSPEDNCEIRKINITNNGTESAVIEITSYAEIVLSSQMADVAHPAFNNLFVRTEVLREFNSLIASRRPRVENDSVIWAVHILNIDGTAIGDIEYETDRYKFIGRGRSISNPEALTKPLSNTVGSVLDPILSLRQKLLIEPGHTASISYVNAVVDSKDDAISLAKKYHDGHNIDRSFELSYIRSHMETKFLNITSEDVECFDSMISHIIYLSPLRRKYAEIINKNIKGQESLWCYGISGDIPIVLVAIDSQEDIDILKIMISAHEYWRSKGLKVDLVILNEDESNYLQPLQDLIRDVVLLSHAKDILDTSGGIFIKSAQIIPQEDIVLLYSVARLVIRCKLGKIINQLNFEENIIELPEYKRFKKAAGKYISNEEPLDLVFFNGFGGFDCKTNEYKIRLRNNNTPAPWSNIIANKTFGTLVTESGSGYTWCENSRENKLTRWSNDPVSDPPSECIYYRDDVTGSIWTTTPLPIKEENSYIITHSFGYTNFIHNSNGINQSLTIFVPTEGNVKYSLVKLKNEGSGKRKLSIFYYIKPILGVCEQITEQFIKTSYSKDNSVILIKNCYNTDFPNRIVYIGSTEKILSYTGDNESFIGVNGNSNTPEGLKREKLSEQTGVGFIPCAAIQITLELNGYEEKEFSFFIGQGKSNDEVANVLPELRSIQNIKKELDKVKEFWLNTLNTIEISTPDKSTDFMLNYWLLYQTLSCRIWARSGFYQSGGAYGFRDQLQDVMSVIYSIPDITRDQILKHCRHQFVDGDVLHWWHECLVHKGIRTKFSDDLIWLPYVTAVYIEKTGDFDILKEVTNYINTSELKENEDERYCIPEVTDTNSSVYTHCIKALDRSLKFGKNGIPLMGSGDWNDGMNTVGNKGSGESVWLGWFIFTTLDKFIPICRVMHDNEHADSYEEIKNNILASIEKNAWDGEWYRRAYFDDGTPLGSYLNNECKIDSLAQTWAVISGAANVDRIAKAMKALEDYLIRRSEGLILLFTPPFDEGNLNPGYIKGYVPGVRENGGQYTHASTWVINAFARMGLGDKAYEMFSLINPINHSRTELECAKYKVEPYVMAADVYAVSPNIGRGGWTWYTGSSGWMYKVGIEEILGFKKKADKIEIDPCIPKYWNEYSIKYKYKNTVYNIVVKNPQNISKGINKIFVDNNEVKDSFINLINDLTTHNVEVIMGETSINEPTNLHQTIPHNGSRRMRNQVKYLLTQDAKKYYHIKYKSFHSYRE